GDDGNRRTADHVVGPNDIGSPTIVNVQRQDDGGGLGEGIDQLVADANLHIGPRRTQTGDRHRWVVCRCCPCGHVSTTRHRPTRMRKEYSTADLPAACRPTARKVPPKPTGPPGPSWQSNAAT